MVKKKKVKPNEKKVSARITGIQSKWVEKMKLTDTELVRYGIMKHRKENPPSSETVLLVEIEYLRDKIEEYELQIEATGLLIQQKVKELVSIRKSRESDEYYFIANNVQELYFEFLDNPKLTREYTSDLLNFYDVYRKGISDIALKTNKSFEEVVAIFEDYLDFRETYDSFEDEGFIEI